MELDPLALYGAVLATAIFLFELYRAFRERPGLDALASSDWPEFKPNHMSDLGGDPGQMYVRLEITNTGGRAVTLHSAGLTIKCLDVRPAGFKQRVVWPLTGRRADRSRVSMTPLGMSEGRTLEPGQSWVLLRRADDVAWDIVDQPIGATRVDGVYARTSRGRMHYWGERAVRDTNVLDLGQPPWGPPTVSLEPEQPTGAVGD